MNDLDNDINKWLETSKKGVSLADLADFLTKLGYTRHGLTDAQREAIEQAEIMLADRGFVGMSRKLRDAFPSTPTPPEPPKSERKVQRWEVTCCNWMDVKSLVAEGWERFCCGVPGSSKS